MDSNAVWKVIGPILMLGMVVAIVGSSLKFKKPLLLALLLVPIVLGALMALSSVKQ